MPLVSRKGILAIAAVIDIALNARGRPVSAKALAARHQLPPRHLEPVLQALVRDGILRGIRGPHGGYELAREQKLITAEDILRSAGSAEDADDVPLPASDPGERRGASGPGRSRAHLLVGAGPDQCRGHDHPLRRTPTACPRDRHNRANFAAAKRLLTVHDLDSFGASPRRGKVQRFAKRCGGHRSHPWGSTECRRPSGRRTRDFVLVRSETDSWPSARSQRCAPRPRPPSASSRRRKPRARAESGSVFAEAIGGATTTLGDQDVTVLALTLGMVFFALLAAIVLLRARRDAARSDIAARDQVVELHAEVDRLKALLMSEPQVLVAWAAGKRRTGNPRRLRPDRARQRHRARARLRQLAGARRRAAHGAGRRDLAQRGPRLRHDADHPRRPAGRSRRPRHRRPRRAAAARCQRHRARTGRSRHPPRQAQQRCRNHEGAARIRCRRRSGRAMPTAG